MCTPQYLAARGQQVGASTGGFGSRVGQAGVIPPAMLGYLYGGSQWQPGTQVLLPIKNTAPSPTGLGTSGSGGDLPITQQSKARTPITLLGRGTSKGRGTLLTSRYGGGG